MFVGDTGIICVSQKNLTDVCGCQPESSIDIPVGVGHCNFVQ
jgi:hypothetical protein